MKYIRKDLIDFLNKHKIKFNKESPNENLTELIFIHSRKSFNEETKLEDVQFVFNIINLKYKKNASQKSLISKLKDYKTLEARGIKNFDVEGIKEFANNETKSHENIVNINNLKIGFRNAINRKQITNIIRGVSFKVKPSEIVGFIGESGSGKSVTARSLFGMNENAITIAEKFDISDKSILIKVKGQMQALNKNKYWRGIRGKKVAYIPQNPMTSLNPTMKIGKQLFEVMHINHKYKKMSKQEKNDEIVRILELFGIANARTRINLYPHEFSRGMRQRVVITMAVLAKPDLIIADEPTTALDPTIQASVLNLLKSIAKDLNIAIIFVSHDISVISTLCDYVNVYYAGRIVECAEKIELFTNPKHPYTWALLSSMPESNQNNEELYTLDGTPPNFDNLPTGDPFSVRNKYAMEIDFREEPPLFLVNKIKGHYAATWLLHPSAPKVTIPMQVTKIAKDILKDLKNATK